MTMNRGLGVWGLMVCVGLSAGCQGPLGGTPRQDTQQGSASTTVRAGQRGAGDDALAHRGFALTPSEVQQPSGTLQVAFSAPVGPLSAPPGVAGAAQVTREGVTTEWRALALVEDTSTPPLVYAVFEDPAAPAQQLVVAARLADVVAGSSLVLDGTQAALVLINDETGEASMGLSGALTVQDASLVAGGTLSAALDVTLTPVTLEQWPEALFPLTYDGTPTERAAATAAGAFDLVYETSGREAPPGTASITSTVEGFAPFSADQSFGGSTGDGYAQLYFLSSDGSQRAVVVVLEESLLAAGEVALGTYDAMAWQLEEDGTQIAFTAGTLTLTGASPVAGAPVAGSLVLSGEAMVFRCGEGDCQPASEEPPPVTTDPQSCEGLSTLPDTFVPSEAGLQEYGPDESVPGFSRALLLVDANQAAVFAALIPDDAVLQAGATVTLGTVEFQGSLFANAVYALESCYDSVVDVESGALTLTWTDDVTGATLAGEGVVTAGGVSRPFSFNLPVASWSAGLEVAPREVP